MTDNVLSFPGALPKRVKAIEIASEPDEDEGWRTSGRPYTRRGPNMQTFVSRSYSLILEASEADLVRDVGCDIGKAQTKLKALKRRLRAVQEHVERLTAADNKLCAAIVAALLSTRSRSEGAER